MVFELLLYILHYPKNDNTLKKINQVYALSKDI